MKSCAQLPWLVELPSGRTFVWRLRGRRRSGTEGGPRRSTRRSYNLSMRAVTSLRVSASSKRISPSRFLGDDLGAPAVCFHPPDVERRDAVRTALPPDAPGTVGLEDLGDDGARPSTLNVVPTPVGTSTVTAFTPGIHRDQDFKSVRVSQRPGVGVYQDLCRLPDRGGVLDRHFDPRPGTSDVTGESGTAGLHIG